MLEKQQQEICRRYGAEYVRAAGQLTLGISRDFASASYPINGLRHPTEHNTCGWFVWSGETLSTDDDFFVPIHVYHLDDICPSILPYLGLAPGWRFLIAPNYEDVWWDDALLEIS